MSFKTELHCHDCIVSACGRITPEETVEKYLAAGYTTLVVTDHISRATYDSANYRGEPDWNAKVDFFLRSYRALQEAAKGKLHILLGAEVRIDSHAAADYLIYGVTEDFLRSHNCLHAYHLTDLSRIVREAGLLFVQAHPFRDYMVVTPPQYLDGVEIYNGSVKHAPFRGEMAALWAKHYHLIPTSGSDLHRVNTPISGGIETEEPITDNLQLLAVLRSGNYRILRDDALLTDDREQS